MTDREIDAHCLNWVTWCQSRRYYLKPGAKNILARMQPSRTGQPPNARNSADMQYFNAAIHSLADMKEHEAATVCFVLFYVDQAPNVKVEASRLGITRPTYYNRARAFAKKGQMLAESLKRATEAMLLNDEMAVD